MEIKVQRYMCIGVFIGALVNFVAFWLIAVYLGGDAVNGRAVGEHFYLSSHGKLTEVSESVWNYSKWHVYSVWVTHPLGLLAAFLYLRLRKQRNETRR